MAKPDYMYDPAIYKSLGSFGVVPTGVVVTDPAGDFWEWVICEWGYVSAGTTDLARVNVNGSTYDLFLPSVQSRNKVTIHRVPFMDVSPTVTLTRLTGTGAVGCIVNLARGYPLPCWSA